MLICIDSAVLTNNISEYWATERRLLLYARKFFESIYNNILLKY